MKSLPTKDSSTQRGAVFVESAIVLPIFLGILFLGLDLVRLSFASASFQNAVNRAGRYATLGFHYPGDNQGATAGVQSVSQKITELSGYPLDRFEICRAGTPSCASNTRAGQGEWVQIKAEAVLPIFFGTKTIRLKAGALVKNEPSYELIDEPPAMNITSNNKVGESVKSY